MEGFLIISIILLVLSIIWLPIGIVAVVRVTKSKEDNTSPSCDESKEESAKKLLLVWGVVFFILMIAFQVMVRFVGRDKRLVLTIVFIYVMLVYCLVLIGFCLRSFMVNRKKKSELVPSSQGTDMSSLVPSSQEADTSDLAPSCQVADAQVVKDKRKIKRIIICVLSAIFLIVFFVTDCSAMVFKPKEYKAYKYAMECVKEELKYPDTVSLPSFKKVKIEKNRLLSIETIDTTSPIYGREVKRAWDILGSGKSENKVGWEINFRFTVTVVLLDGDEWYCWSCDIQ